MLVTKGILQPVGVNAGVRDEEAQLESRTEASGPPEGASEGDRLPDSYIRIGGDLHGLSARWMKFILKELEPVSMGPFAIRALIMPGKREIDLGEAAHILELMTDLDEMTPLTGSMRTVSVLLSECHKLNKQNGRPAQALQLPPVWDRDGWYACENRTRFSLTLVKQFSGGNAKCVVTPEQLGMTDGKEFAAVKLERNWSKKTAFLVDSSGLNKITRSDLFPKGQFKPEVKIGVKRSREEPHGETMAAPVTPVNDAKIAVKQRLSKKTPVTWATSEPGGRRAAVALPVPVVKDERFAEPPSTEDEDDE